MGTKGNISVSLVISVLLFGTVGPALAGTIYVDANAALGGDGTTWGTAYKYLQDAFYKPPTSGDEIWVAAGTYKPDQDEGGNVTLGDRNATFELKDGVSIYGGFPIGGGTWDDRDPNIYETILSGDVNEDDEPNFVNNGENSYHVTHIGWLSGTTVLDGFIIRGGNANSDFPNNTGGGLLNNVGGNILVSNCIFTQNQAYGYGGGIRLVNLNITGTLIGSTIMNCKFKNNKAGRGGGMGLRGFSPVVANCIFIGNSSCALHCASFGGWPEDEIYSNPIIINSEFIGNFSDYNGGAIYFRGECHATLINCALIGNSAVYEGGAIMVDPVFQSTPAILQNCTLAANSAGTSGGIASIYPWIDSTLSNCIVWGNKDNTGINESSQIQSGLSITVTSSCIQDDDPNDGYIPFGGEPNHNIDDNPNFVRDPNDGGDGWGVGDNDDFGDLHLLYTSPCIDTGDNTAVPPDTADLDEDLNTTEPIPYDLDEHPRIVDGDCNSTDIVDMGAYEFSYLYLGDFAGGCDVDFADFAVLALAWLTEEGQVGYDSNCDIALPYDGAIDEKDLQVFSDNWLLGR